MAESWIEECLVLLEMMNSSNAQTFGAAHAKAYGLILCELGEEASRTAVTRALKTLRWRPSPAEIREIAADLASPLPPVGLLWQEFWHKAITDGYARPDWTHPILDDMAAQMGGWQSVRETSWPDSHPAHVDAQRIRFEAIYAQVLGQWREAVCEQLSLPRASRDPRYFPARRDFVAPKLLPPSGDYAPLPSFSELIENAPEDIRQKLTALRRQIGS